VRLAVNNRRRAALLRLPRRSRRPSSGCSREANCYTRGKGSRCTRPGRALRRWCMGRVSTWPSRSLADSCPACPCRRRRRCRSSMDSLAGISRSTRPGRSCRCRSTIRNRQGTKSRSRRGCRCRHHTSRRQSRCSCWSTWWARGHRRPSTKSCLRRHRRRCDRFRRRSCRHSSVWSCRFRCRPPGTSNSLQRRLQVRERRWRPQKKGVAARRDLAPKYKRRSRWTETPRPDDRFDGPSGPPCYPKLSLPCPPTRVSSPPI
jgi:hypothetical protein